MISVSLIREIAPPLKSGGRPLAVHYLHDIYSNGLLAPLKLTPLTRASLKLCALQHQFAGCVLADRNPQYKLPKAQRWYSEVEPAIVSVPVREIVWGERKGSTHESLPKTRRWVESLPSGIVDHVLKWAPPVVTENGRDSGHVVIANHMTAVLARYLMPEEKIATRQLVLACSLRRNLEQVCIITSMLATPVFSHNRKFLARSADTLQDAQVLTGYSKAWCARLRQGEE